MTAPRSLWRRLARQVTDYLKSLTILNEPEYEMIRYWMRPKAARNILNSRSGQTKYKQEDVSCFVGNTEIDFARMRNLWEDTMTEDEKETVSVDLNICHTQRLQVSNI